MGEVIGSWGVAPVAYDGIPTVGVYFPGVQVAGSGHEPTRAGGRHGVFGVTGRLPKLRWQTESP